MALVSQAMWAGSAHTGADRYVRYGFTLQNTSDQVIPRAELWVCAPLKKAAGQEGVTVRASQPYEAAEDRMGNHILYFVFSNMAPYSVKLVTIEVDLWMGTVANLPAPKGNAWLGAEPLVEIEDPEFRAEAPTFNVTNVMDKARAIYEWVRENMQDGGYDARDRGALFALIHRKGDCTEYALLFTALCRLNGIPARAMGGYRTDRNTVLGPVDYHNWAEFYAQGAWRIADPHGGVFDDQTGQYLATRILGESDSPLGSFARYRGQGEGLKVEMMK